MMRERGLEALKQRCDVVSMSIEEKVLPNTPFNPKYEAMGRRALDGGLLIVAAAGNFSNRASGFIMPVSAPANSPSILAVGAIGPFGQGFRVSSFSNGGINPNASEVDIAAPGETIHSSLLPDRYGRRSGTSMAAPFVAGIAALFAQADPAARGRDLGQLLQRSAFNIGARPEDAGAGLVQAPL
jgi:subtilisin family serine protease